MTTRIERRFAALKAQNRAALVGFITAGDPDLATSAALLAALPEAGLDVVELGMPFTDPMADGPVIQAAGLRALQGGQTMVRTLDLVRAFRARDADTPLVLMGYYNPIYIYGVDRFLADASDAGVDGLIVVDLPPEEDAELCRPALAAGLNFIRLATPTTDDKRLPTVLTNTSGFVYYVSVTGITGVAKPDYGQVEVAVRRIKQHTGLPVAVGFGVKSAEDAGNIARHADGVVVGSALISAMAATLDHNGQASAGTVPAAVAFVQGLAEGGARRPRRRVTMNWMLNVVPPKIRSFLKRETPENLWVKCPDSGQLVHHKDLEANLFVVPGSGFHMRMATEARLKTTFDEGVFTTVAVPEVLLDPLRFRDEKRYVDKLKDARTKTGLNDAVMVGVGTIHGQPVTVAVQDFDFIGGSLGMAAGEAVIAGIEHAVANRTPFVLFAASGGARMHEGIFSLMQMPRTTVAVGRLRAARLPYIVVLTNPTTGGVTASYAMLGDIHLAEPGALIGFAGPRVIEQTVREKLPEGFQRAEYLQQHGMVDKVVPRGEMRDTLARLCSLLMHRPVEAADATALPAAA